MPNVLITGGGGGTGGTNFRMRGIPGVGTYIDGVWQVGTAGFLTNEFVEIDRVEVLRGPQGTMFGRDSTGGAIRIWTARPAEEFGGNIAATAGSNERFDVKASLDLPLSEKVRTKWTAANMSRDGYIYSQTTGESGGNIDQQIFRGDIVFDATENLDFRFNYQNDKSEFTEPRVQDAMFRTYDDSNPNWVKGILGLPEMYTYVGTDYRGNPVEPFFVPANQVAGHPGGRVGQWENRSGTTLPNVYDTEQMSLETNWRLTDNLTLQFLTASTSQDADSVVDWDNSQYDLVLDMNRSKLDVFSQEMQLTGGRDRFEWLAGAYYWDQENYARNGRWQVNEFQKQLMNPQNVFDNPVCNPVGAVLEDTPTPAGQNPDNPNNRRFQPGTMGLVTNGAYAGQMVQLGGAPGTGAGAWKTCQQEYYTGVGGAYDTLARSGQDGWAVFGEATIHLTDRLDLTLGVRQHDQSGYSVNMFQSLASLRPSRSIRRSSTSATRSSAATTLRRTHRSSSTSSRRGSHCRCSSRTTSWATSATRKGITRVASRRRRSAQRGRCSRTTRRRSRTWKSASVRTYLTAGCASTPRCSTLLGSTSRPRASCTIRSRARRSRRWSRRTSARPKRTARNSS